MAEQSAPGVDLASGVVERSAPGMVMHDQKQDSMIPFLAAALCVEQAQQLRKSEPALFQAYHLALAKWLHWLPIGIRLYEVVADCAQGPSDKDAQVWATRLLRMPTPPPGTDLRNRQAEREASALRGASFHMLRGLSTVSILHTSPQVYIDVMAVTAVDDIPQQRDAFIQLAEEFLQGLSGAPLWCAPLYRARQLANWWR